MYIKDIISNFRVYGSFIRATYNNIGHINLTYIVEMNQGGNIVKYLLQRVNKEVFKSPEIIMSNIETVLSHLEKKLKSAYPRDYSRRLITIINTVENKPYLVLEGYIWRVFFFIEDTESHSVPKAPEQAEIIGECFGNFQFLLSDLDYSLLSETIENFHDGRSRFKKFLNAVSEDRVGRLKTCKEEVDLILSYKDEFEVFPKLIEDNKIPIRVTHNDTKINNLLFDKATGEGICVIDLDTIMPGIIHFDFGDMVRTATATEAEDSKKLDNVKMNFDMFQALAHGYIRSTYNFITGPEIDYLAFSGVYIVRELASRFLVDYLNGDVYFKTSYDIHNLDRAKNQIALANDIAKNEKNMKSYMEKVAGVKL